MKTKAGIVATVLIGVVLVAVFFVASRIRLTPPTTVYFNFVGFRNSTNGWEAIFYVTNWPRSSTAWLPEQLTYYDGLHWRETNFNRSLGLSVQYQTNITVAFRVPGTNVPVRMVTKLDSELEGWWPRTRRKVFRALRVPYTERGGTVRRVTNDVTSVQIYPE